MNVWERAVEALTDGILTIRQLRDNGPGLVAHHGDALEAMLAAKRKMERWEAVEGRTWIEQNVVRFARAARPVPSDPTDRPAVLLVRKEADNG